MKYGFPKIDRIEPLLNLIKDRKEFIVAERGWYNVINYVVMTEDTFPAITSNTDPSRIDDAILLRECRGIVFDNNGDILHRSLHKFFNLNERFETQAYKLDFNDPHHVLEKYDGSMVRPLFNRQHNGFRMATKMGVTDVAFNAEVFVSTHVKYFKFFRYCVDNNLSPIFEWVSSKNRIVVLYEKENLVLIAVRETDSGKYLTFPEMIELGGKFDIPVGKGYGTVSEIDLFLKLNDSKFKGMEGFVIRFDDGHMVKLKTDEYLIQHKSKDIVSSNRQVVELILSEKIDDIKPRLIPEDLQKVEGLEKETFSVMTALSSELENAYKKYGKMDRTNFAVNVANKLSPFVRKGVFSMMDGKNSMSLTKEFLLNNVKTESKLGNLKSVYGVFKNV